MPQTEIKFESRWQPMPWDMWDEWIRRRIPRPLMLAVERHRAAGCQVNVLGTAFGWEEIECAGHPAGVLPIWRRERAVTE